MGFDRMDDILCDWTAVVRETEIIVRAEIDRCKLVAGKSEGNAFRRLQRTSPYLNDQL